MANFARVKALGWNLFDLLASALMNQLDIDHAKAINGDDGSSHAPGTQIVINGAGMKFGGPVAFDVGSDPHVKANTTLTIDNVGDLDVASGGAILGHAGSIFGFGAGTFFCDDVTITTGGKCKLNARDVPRLLAEANFSPFVAAGWSQQGDGSWVCTAVSSGSVAGGIVPLRVPHGSTLKSVSILIQPQVGHAAFPGGKPSNMPSFTVYEQQGATRTPLLGGTVTDASATAGAFETAHTLTANGASHVIDRVNCRYYLQFNGENDGGGGTNSVSGSKFWNQVSFTASVTSYDED